MERPDYGVKTARGELSTGVCAGTRRWLQNGRAKKSEGQYRLHKPNRGGRLGASPAAVEMVINLKSAKSLDLSIPPFLLARANRVVD